VRLTRRLVLFTTVLIVVLLGAAGVVAGRRQSLVSPAGAGAAGAGAAGAGAAGAGAAGAGAAGATAPDRPGLRRDWLLFTAAALLAGGVAARLLAASISRPIAELRDVAQALADGDLSRRPALLADGEIGALGEALRRLAEQSSARMDALQADEALLAALTESLNEAVIALDARQRVVRINETARQLLRLRAPVPFSADYLPRDRALRESLAEVLRGEVAPPAEVRVDDRSLTLTARPLPDGGAILALYDLTPFRRLEAVRRDFVANVSHELRTPLTVIAGFVETLADEELPGPLRRQFLGMAAANVRRMQRIVDDLLDLSRIESGGWLPNPADLDVRALASEILAPLQATADAKGVRLSAEVPASAESVYVDPTAARQVLSNLAENALRHTSVGHVTLFAEPADEGVWLGVRDTGTGIPEEHLPRIFERFYRADPGRSREAGGTGLGLSIVRHLAEAHGGRVRAESAIGVGTTIAALFPSAQAAGRAREG
jgi:two-component system phosphate regulon sensor histidine kinase PhoR